MSIARLHNLHNIYTFRFAHLRRAYIFALFAVKMPRDYFATSYIIGLHPRENTGGFANDMSVTLISSAFITSAFFIQFRVHQHLAS